MLLPTPRCWLLQADAKDYVDEPDPKFPLAEAMKNMDLEQAQHLETISPKPLNPWRPPVFGKFDIEIDRKKAVQKVITFMNSLEAMIYSDAVAKRSASA